MQNWFEILTSLSEHHIYIANLNRLATQAVNFHLLKLKPLESGEFETYSTKQQQLRNCLHCPLHISVKSDIKLYNAGHLKCHPGNKCHGTPMSRQIRGEKWRGRSSCHAQGAGRQPAVILPLKLLLHGINFCPRGSENNHEVKYT